MDNKRYMLALALCMGVIILWTYFVLPPPKPPVPVDRRSSPAEASPGSAPSSHPEAAAPAPLGAASEAPATPPELVPKEEATEEAEKVVETPLYRIRLGNRGGRVLGWELKTHLDDHRKPLQLVSIASGKLHRFPLDLEFDDAKLTAKVESSLFVTDVETESDPGRTRVTFRYSDGSGLSVKKTLQLSDTSYVVRLDVQARIGEKALRPALFWGVGFGPETGLPPDNGDRNDITRLVCFHEGRVTLTSRDNLKNTKVLDQTGPFAWAGIEDHYFAALVLPEKGAQSVRLRRDAIIEEGREKQFLSISIRPAETIYQIYVGPKDRNLMAGLGLGIERIVDYGYFGAIAQALFFLLRGLNRITGNWGFSIIILTFVIRLAFFPLTHKGSVSMRRTQEKMKKLQPRIESIKKKYRSMKKDMANRQKMNEEIMALYSKEGMNPMAGLTGCLPLLLQLPILWGFYNLLVNAFELRHAPFIFWITDLSKKDPYYITPIVMGVSMLIQQVMTGSSIPDPMQRKVMMFMPLMFTWFFKDLPSGLVLYWLVNNILGIGQQYLINAQVARESSSSTG
jgi:YidC/Oxa1 family membrane protein insertase